MPTRQISYFRTTLWSATTAVVICSSPLKLWADDTVRKSPIAASQICTCDKHIANSEKKNAVGDEVLLNQGADTEFPRGNYGDSPLMHAAESGATETVKLLVNQGASIDPKGTFHGRTPLTQAALMGHLDVVRFLVERGANVNANCTRHGHSSYLIAEGIGPRNPTPLGSAAEGGQASAIEYLLRKRAKINGQDGSSYTPLMWACEVGSPEAVRALLRHGADATIKTDLGKTARSMAAARKDATILALLDGVNKK